MKGLPVVVEEIEIDEKVESCLRGEGVVKQGRGWPPNVESESKQSVICDPHFVGIYLILTLR